MGAPVGVQNYTADTHPPKNMVIYYRIFALFFCDFGMTERV
jgi:hypothetical protein